MPPLHLCLAAALIIGAATGLDFLATDCSVPKANGGLGFCGPANVSRWSAERRVSAFRPHAMQCSALSVSLGPCTFASAPTPVRQSTGCMAEFRECPSRVRSTQDYQGQVNKVVANCRACQQSSLPMCSRASLAALIGASSGTVKVSRLA